MWQDKQPIALVIVDDHPVVLHGLETLLQQDERIAVRGGFTTGMEALAFVQQHTVHVVLLDISLPDIHGAELCRRIKQVSPATVVLGFSNHAERLLILQLLQNGASGYLLKNVAAAELMTCMEEALNGQVAFSSEVKQIMARAAVPDVKAVAPLTKREKQILRLIADGRTNQQMADELSLSVLTVETHRRNLMQKFEVKNVAALLKAAMAEGLLS
ncbi:DNA-binding response regulator [Chitinophaga parva]|uniref:DNA-binding response regulator n=1 Tax=Chitinophaga parva TaxID=2169414 RepID=A0A2T7BCH2_9BACT|nr:response regulator transcription factor [Chitinophaga parva]PUZ22777.1 DNA-binding response regulator [Chitinophaga parva]